MENTKKILTGNFSPSVTVSIHQPNYIPWLGFFEKIMNSDIYVVFDDVQYPRGKDFANRNQIKTNTGKLWLTIPIKDKGIICYNKTAHLKGYCLGHCGHCWQL